METKTNGSAPSAIVLVLAWLIVGVPLVWGVAQTVHKALPLFGAGAQ